jgi:hypothetical protein
MGVALTNLKARINMNKSNMLNEPPVARDGAFGQILSGYQSGEILDEMGAAIRSATQAATGTGKPAKVTLELTIAISGNAIAVTPKVSEKLPKVEATAAIFFADDDYNLVRNDPRQSELALRVVTNTGSEQEAGEPLRKAQAV